MVDFPKNDFWQVVVLTPTGVTPGVYTNPTLTIAEDGRITLAASGGGGGGGGGASGYVADMAALALLNGADQGTLVTVIDGGNTYNALYVSNGATFNQVGSSPVRSVRYVQQAIGFSSATVSLGAPIQTNAVIRRVLVQITTPYTAGTTIVVRGAGGTIYAGASETDATVANTYVIEYSTETAVGGGNAQLQALVTGGPSAGAALITVEYLLPL